MTFDKFVEKVMDEITNIKRETYGTVEVNCGFFSIYDYRKIMDDAKNRLNFPVIIPPEAQNYQFQYRGILFSAAYIKSGTIILVPEIKN